MKKQLKSKQVKIAIESYKKYVQKKKWKNAKLKAEEICARSEEAHEAKSMSAFTWRLLPTKVSRERSVFHNIICCNY